VVYNAYLIAELVGFVHIMGCQENGCSLLVYVPYIIPYPYPCLRVRPDCRLVHEKHFWPSHKSSCDLKSVLHPATKVALLEYPAFPQAQPGQATHQLLPVLQLLAWNRAFHDIPESLSRSYPCQG